MKTNLSRVRRIVVWGLPSLAIGLLLMGCSPSQSGEGQGGIRFPDYVAKASQPVKDAYQFAVDHPELLRYIPCWCNCGPIGHDSNLDCYIAGSGGDGSPRFTDHGAN